MRTFAPFRGAFFPRAKRRHSGHSDIICYAGSLRKKNIFCLDMFAFVVFRGPFDKGKIIETYFLTSGLSVTTEMLKSKKRS